MTELHFVENIELPFVDYAEPARAFSGLVIVGEAPGADEVEQGRPFVGRSGRLLQEALTAAGIDRESCLVANVFRYRPPENKVGHFFISKRAAKAEGVPISQKFGRTQFGFMRSCYTREIAHLAMTLVRARAVITLGAVPLWALTRKTSLKELEGQTGPIHGYLCKAPIFATYHPAFILRGNPVPEWIETMRQAQQQIEQGRPEA